MTPRRTIADREDVLSVLMLAPSLAYVILLVGVPFCLAILLSFSNATAGNLRFEWVGFANYGAILVDPVFLRALRNSAVVTVGSQTLVVVLATAAAQVFRATFPGKHFARFVLLLPWAVPVSLAAIAWTWIFDSTFSVINWVLKVVGWFGPGQWYFWLGDTTLGMIAIITIHVWRMLPFSTVILLAGLTSIPSEVHEAADIDGAGPLAKAFQITLPMMLPILSVAVLFGVVFTFTDMSVVYLLTRGGPYNSTHVLASLAYQDGVLGGDVGRGAAIALFLLPVLVVMAVFMLRASRRAEVA